MNQNLFPSDKIFSVSEINSILKEIIEGTFPTLTIEGEISNYRPNSSGHLYFKLKDSCLKAVHFTCNLNQKMAIKSEFTESSLFTRRTEIIRFLLQKWKKPEQETF